MKKDIIFVAIQAMLFIVYIFNVEFQRIVTIELIRQVGLAGAILGGLIILVALLQLNKNLSPFPTPKAGSELIKNGLYALVRHPIYTGIILGSFSYGVYRDSLWKVAIAGLFLLLFHFKAKYEESLLIARFGEEYESYMKNSGRFSPKIV